MKISSQALLLAVSALSVRGAAGVAVGDKVCMTGYVMDNYCIDRGTFLDNPNAMTLKEPENHSIYCLVEAPPCPLNGYQVLGDPCEEGGDHTIGFRLDNNQTVLDAIRAVGKKGSADVAQTCKTCTNEDEDAPTHGYRATVRGTVSELGTNSAANLDTNIEGLSTALMAPMLTDIEVLGDDVACEDDEVTVAPECLLPKVGDEVCMTGYVMDNYCIDRGTFLDNANAMTLVEPDTHSIYCLVEAPPCPLNGYQVLGDPCDGEGDYTPGFRLDNNQTVLDAIRAVGKKGSADVPQTCVTCTNEDADAQTHGYRATIKGTISELGSKSAANIAGMDGNSMAHLAPLLTNIEVGPDVTCDDPAKPPQCIAGIAPPSPPTPPPTASPVMAGEGTDTSKCPDDLPNHKMLSDVVNLCYAFVPSTSADANDGVLKGRVAYDGEGWVAMALSLDDKMGGSEGIIGLPDADTVMKYNVGFYTTPTAMADDKQTLVAGSIMQEDGNTVLTFTKLLKEEGEIEVVEGTNKFLFAYGSGNALSFHAAKGPFELELIAPGGTAAPTKLPTTASPTISTSPTASASPTDKVADSSDFLENELAPGYLQRYNVDEAAGTVSMELIYQGDAWIAIAFSTTGSMVGSEAVIGLPGAGTVEKYNLSAQSDAGVTPMAADKQTLTGTSIKTEGGVTTVTFTKLLKEAGEIEISAGDNTFLWAYGSGTSLAYHGTARKSFSLNLSTGVAATLQAANRAKWLAHGVMAFLAWGVCVPIAISSSLLRQLLPKGPTWFLSHRFFNSLCYALFIAFFILAVVTVNNEGATHWFGPHQKMGLAMFVIVSVQVLSGFTRPHLPPPDSADPKSSVRRLWEYSHRLTGTILLACGMWQMQEGIKLFATKYSEDDNVIYALYWAYLGLFLGGVILVKLFLLSRTPAPSESGTPAQSPPA